MKAPELTPFDWWPIAGVQMPTRDEARTSMIRSLAGDYPGPNRIVIAAVIVDHWLDVRDRTPGLPPFHGEELTE